MVFYPSYSYEDCLKLEYNTAECNKYVYDYEQDIEKIKSVFGL